MFKIVNNGGLVVQQQMTKEVAKPSARGILKERSAGAIASIDKDESQYVKNAYLKFPQDAVRNARIYKKSYEATLPETLSPEAQNKMWVRAKELKDRFTQGMLSKEEMHPVKGFMDGGTMKWVVDEEKLRSGRCVERNAFWERKYGKEIQEFKNIMRHLNPDDPNAGDVEKFRPRGGKG